MSAKLIGDAPISLLIIYIYEITYRTLGSVFGTKGVPTTRTGDRGATGLGGWFEATADGSAVRPAFEAPTGETKALPANVTLAKTSPNAASKSMS